MRTLIGFVVAAGLVLMFRFGLRLEREAYVLFGVGVLLSLGVHPVVDRMHALHRQTAEGIYQVTHLEFTLERVKDPEAVVKGRAALETARQVLGPRT